MLPFSDVLDLFADKFTGLCGGCFPFPGIFVEHAVTLSFRARKHPQDQVQLSFPYEQKPCNPAIQENICNLEELSPGPAVHPRDFSLRHVPALRGKPYASPSAASHSHSDVIIATA